MCFITVAVTGFWALRDNTYDVHAVITVAMVKLLRDFGSYGIMFMTVYCFGYPRHS
jgi:hypothetical protein